MGLHNSFTPVVQTHAVNQLLRTLCCLLLLVGCSSTAASTSLTTTTLAATTSAADQPWTTTQYVCDDRPALGLPYRSIEGVDPDLLSVDIYPVAGECNAPVVIWIHGGGWQIGDKGNGAVQRADFYNSHGWLLVAVNYRLTTDVADPPVAYPDHNKDAAAALGWIDRNIAAHGGDPTSAMLTGHSAGGSIAASLIADPSYLAAYDMDPSWLDCAVLLDTAGYYITTAASSAGSSDVYQPAFGTDPEVWAQASPIGHVGEGPLPANVLVVTRGLRSEVTRPRPSLTH